MRKVTAPIYYFVAVMGVMTFALGMGLALQVEKFTSNPAYGTLFEICPPEILSIFLIISGTIMLVAFFTRDYVIARIGLVIFGTYLAMEATSFFIEYVNGSASTWGWTRSLGLLLFCGIGAFAQFPNTKG
jgi:hypothetical protein